VSGLRDLIVFVWRYPAAAALAIIVGVALGCLTGILIRMAFAYYFGG
jgi:hypothetical protein